MAGTNLYALNFENNGVSVILSNPHLSGAAYQQAEECWDAAGINMSVVDGTLALWPRGGFRAGTAAHLAANRHGSVSDPHAARGRRDGSL